MQLMELSSENSQLRAENATLKNELSKHRQENISVRKVEPIEPTLSVSHKTKLIEETASISKAQKITLFRSLFRGRDDVYPARWEISVPVSPVIPVQLRTSGNISKLSRKEIRANS